TGIMKNKQLLLFLILLLAGLMPSETFSQVYSNQNHPGYDALTRALYQPGVNLHSSLKPYRLDQVEAYMNTDSLFQRGLRKPSGHLNIWQRFLHDDFIKWEEKGDHPITVTINPYFNFEVGKEQSEGKNTWVNTRGVMLNGQLGKNLAFHGALFENQAVLPQYLED